MALTRAQILAIIDRGETVTVWDTRYDSHNRASVPTDLQLSQIYSAQQSASDPSPDSRFYIMSRPPTLADGRMNDVWMDLSGDTPFLWLKYSPTAWVGMYSFPPSSFPRPDYALSDLTDVQIGSQLNGNGLFFNGDLSKWSVRTDLITSYRRAWQLNGDLSVLYRAGDIVTVTVGPTTTFYMYTSSDAGQESDPATDDGSIWKPLGAAGAGGGAVALDDLTDVIIDHASTGHIIEYDGTNWVNTPKGGPYLGVANNLNDLSDVELALTNLGLGNDTVNNPMTAGGAMIVGQATSNFALASVGASITGSAAYAGNVAANVIDGNDATKYQSVALIAGVQLTIDLGAVRTIGTIRLKQPGPGGGSANTYNIQTSPDGSSWTTLWTHNTILNDETYNIVPQMSRYWRFVALTPRGADDGWHVFTIDLYTSTTGAGTPIQLPAGSPGQVLMMVAGVPTWVTPPWT